MFSEYVINQLALQALFVGVGFSDHHDINHASEWWLGVQWANELAPEWYNKRMICHILAGGVS